MATTTKPKTARRHKAALGVAATLVSLSMMTPTSTDTTPVTVPDIPTGPVSDADVAVNPAYDTGDAVTPPADLPAAP